MVWLTESDIFAILSKKDFDIRATKNARWIDQKCTPDVVCIVSDCIEKYVEAKGNTQFSSSDIWHYDYTVQNIEQIFSKPDLNRPTSHNEYDKYFQQPMELLSVAGVLLKSKIGNRNYYSVANYELLSYIAMRERNSLIFLQIYIERVLTDSGLIDDFEEFYRRPTPETYTNLKTRFEVFTTTYTPINGKTECRRIFTKIINPLAFKRRTRGTENGRLSQHSITYDELMYNRDNFRDLYSGKPKGMTRSEYATTIGVSPNSTYNGYLVSKAKRFLREFNNKYRDGRSEVRLGPDASSTATHMHHIFPESRFPEIADKLENIIALSPTQHLNYAHPLNNTQIVDKSYQRDCLIAKSANIHDNLHGPKDQVIYDFDRFLYVLSIGFSSDDFEDIEEMDFAGIIIKINLQYS